MTNTSLHPNIIGYTQSGATISRNGTSASTRVYHQQLRQSKADSDLQMQIDELRRENAKLRVELRGE